MVVEGTERLSECDSAVMGGQQDIPEATEEEVHAAIKSNVDKNCLQNGELDLVDMSLVDQLREMLEAEWSGENNQGQYSEAHYRDLMDLKSPFTCWRYLIHCDRKVESALETIKSALIWRKANDADESLNKNMVKEFWFYAPIFACGDNKDGLDVVYVIGRHYRKPNAKLAPIMRKYTQNLLFSWDREHKHDLRRVCFVFDVTDTGIKNIDMDFMSWFVSLRDYLPARIAKAYVIGIPLLVRPLVKIIISWLPEKLRKVVECGTFDQLVATRVEPDDLPQELGGHRPLEFYRLAPVDAPWAADSPLFDEAGNMQKYLEESLLFHVPEEQRQKLRANQEEYENKTLKR